MEHGFASRGIEPIDLDVFTRLVEEELMHLAIYNELATGSRPCRRALDSRRAPSP
jgi:hypothetical protein